MNQWRQLLMAGWGVGLLFFGGETAPAVTIDSPSPQGTILAIYDTGLGLVSDQRRVVLARGDNLVRFMGVPVHIDPVSVSVSSQAGSAAIQVLDQRFEYDLAGVERLLQRYVGQPVVVQDGTDEVSGTLLPSEAGPSDPAALALLGASGDAMVYPDRQRLDEVVFPQAQEKAFLQPTLIARLNASQDGPQNLRLNYVTEGLNWSVSYEAIQSDEGSSSYLGIRAGVKNQSGTSFKDARVRLVTTERGGMLGPVAPYRGPEEAAGGAAQRYAYGQEAPAAEQMVASAATLQTYELPGQISVENGAQVFVQLAQVQKLPISRFYVYDGVRFDRFPRNRRNDWNYGTEFRKTVDTYLQFSNTASDGLGFNLPPGQFRLYRQTESGALDLVGQAYMSGTPVGGSGYVALGPAKDLVGARERTGYSEIVPLHEYEESFEIRLENGSAEEVEIRVVEHLYRWSEFEIIKADAEYVQTGPQTIEFGARLKPGGKRSVHYTVHYRW